MLLHGVVTLLFRDYDLAEMASVGLWVIGLFVGIQMILNGWSLVMLALAVKNLPDEDEALAAPAF